MLAILGSARPGTHPAARQLRIGKWWTGPRRTWNMGIRLRRTELQLQLDQQTHTLPVARCRDRYPQSYLLSVTRVGLECASIHGILVHSHSAPIPIPHSSHPTQSAALVLALQQRILETLLLFSCWYHLLFLSPRFAVRVDLNCQSFHICTCTLPSSCADQRDRLRPARSLFGNAAIYYDSYSRHTVDRSRFRVRELSPEHITTTMASSKVVKPAMAA